VHCAETVPQGVPRGRGPGGPHREPGQSLKQIATDFGIAESCLRNWLRQADVEDDRKPGMTGAENAELREARKRIRLLEQENEVLRRAAAYLSQANLPGK
jgi:transposase